MLFKIFFIWSSRSPFVQCNGTIYTIFLKGHYEKQFCEIIFNLGQWFRRRCRLKRFVILSSGIPSVSVEWNHLFNFGRRHHKENSVKLF